LQPTNTSERNHNLVANREIATLHLLFGTLHNEREREREQKAPVLFLDLGKKFSIEQCFLQCCVVPFLSSTFNHMKRLHSSG
jgi:hypothetical protein